MKHKTYAYYLVTGVHTFCVIKNPKNPTSGFSGFWRGTRDLSKCCAFAVHRLHVHYGSNTSLYKHPRCLYHAQALVGSSPWYHQKLKKPGKRVSWVLARHEGLEPPTDRFEVCDSIHWASAPKVYNWLYDYTRCLYVYQGIYWHLSENGCRITIHVLQLNKEKAETSILC